MATNAPRRLGFTLVELLVVIAIIGLLVALLLPAVQGARERGRQLQCLNNIGNLAKAAFNYDSSKGQLPGLTQFVKRKQNEYASVSNDMASVINVANPPNLKQVAGLSWATTLLPKLERADIWDQIQNPPVAGTAIPAPPMAVFTCPSDQDAQSRPGLAALSYSANSGSWDRDSSGVFLYSSSQKSGRGDTSDNGVFFDLAELGRQQPPAKIPTMRIGAIKDGAGTTIMFVENFHKSYFDSANQPLFTWLTGTEQQLGIVWVVPTNGTAPVAGNTIHDQERINGDELDTGEYPGGIPRFARPASAHVNGANIVFCDGHAIYLRQDIDYKVYQALMTPNGRKCVDPDDHTAYQSAGQAIYEFRAAPPLSEKDYE